MKISFMKSPVFFSLLMLFTSLFFTSCEKEYSCEGCAGVAFTRQATYSFSGGNTNCTGAIVSGSYIAGTAVSDANAVVLNVVVDSVGVYSIATERVNGILFSATGRFTATGPQTIILTAFGTPTTAGNFNFTAGSSGCSFTVTVAPVIDNNFIYFYEATIDGAVYKETVTTTNGNRVAYSVQGSDDVVLSSSILPISYPPMPAGKTGLAVSKGVMHNYLAANNTEFITFFNLGDYSYSSDVSVTDGVNITWYDQSGTAWRTDNPPADQSGSSFKIVQVAPVTPSTIYTISTTFSFNCKLYDQGGNVKTLTNGTYKGEYQQQ